MTGWLNHLPIAPIIIPLVAGILMILLGERRRSVKAGIGVISTLLLIAAAVKLLILTDSAGPRSEAIVSAYRLGNWPVQFAIVLVVDRLSALMLVLTGILGFAVLSFSLARWHRAGIHFHPLFQFQLMGLSGSFLTGDIFNLFVFFEIMLAASYGLVLHGSGIARVRAGLHYVVINLVASLFFLIGASMIYGIAGTLNMADLAQRMASIAQADRALLEAGVAILGITFLIKAAMWPLGFWLPPTYAAANPASAAIISILSKVGIYAIIRLWLLLFGDGAGVSTGFGGAWIHWGGLLTIAFGCIAVLATQNMARLAGASVLISSGTLLTAIGVGQTAVTGGALFYLVSSVLAIAAFFMLIELIERGRVLGADVLAVTREAFGEASDEDLDEEKQVGIAIPATMAILGLSFAGCALVLSGLPPFPSFLAKFAILTPLLHSGIGEVPAAAWTVLAALLVSGLATIIATTRTGIDVFWASPAATVPRISIFEIAPVALLLILCSGLTIMARPVMQYMDATAKSLHAPNDYIQSVFPALPAPSSAEGNR